MDLNRLFQCRGDGLVYIKHLELRILELEKACSSRCPDSLECQQQIGRQCRPCEVCRNPNLYQGLGGSREIFADSIRLASESGDDNQSIASESYHDNQSSQHSRTPERTYAFIPYEPTASSVVKDSSTPTKPTQRKRNHLSLFTSLVSNLPKSSDWKNWASINETQRKDIVFCLVSGIAVPKNDSPIASEQPATIPILLKKYATSMKPVGMKRTSAESEVNSPFARFKELLFCSLCAVALEVMPKEIVFQYMQSVFCCDAQPKALRGRIRGAKWANRAIYLLSRTNWGSCSWDIIYVASNQVNFYSEFNDYSIKPDEFINGLKPEFNPENTKTISVPLAIPSIIRTIFEDLVPLEKICECLGYELGDYNKLDLSGLETLLAQKTNTEPSKKRKIWPSNTPSKRRCRNSSSRLSEGDPLDTSNGSSHSPIYATSSPSAPNSCSDPPINELFEYSTNASTPTEGSLESPANSDIDDLFEEHPTSTSTPNESPLNNGTTEANDEIMDGSVDGIYLSTPINDPSTLQSISFNHSPPKDNMPDLALSLSNDIRAQSYPSVVDFEPEIRGSRPATSLLSGSNIFPNLDAESSMVTSSTSTEMNGTLNLESNSSSNIETSSARTTLSQTFSPNDITQQQGLSANDPQLPPSTDLWQQYDWELDGILQQGFPANDPQLLPSTHLCQQYDWELDGILQQGFPANDPQLLPSTHLWQQYDWELDGILQQGFPANDPQLLPSTHLWQQYDWELDGILQQGFPANDPQLPPSTDRSQQCSSDLLQQDLSLSSHSPLPSLGLGQDAATAISGNSPETRYHLLIRPSLVSREGGSSWDLENSHHALGFSDAIHQNASYSPNRSLSVM